MNMQKSLSVPLGSSLRNALWSVPTKTQRGVHDIAITRTGKPVIRVQGGRLVFHEH